MVLKPLLLFCLVALHCPLLHGAEMACGIKLIITTDVHGHVMADTEKGRIGYARLMKYADADTEAGWRVFLMDSGDAFSGSAFAQADHGRSLAELLGIMGYRVLTPGNHAFDHNAVERDPLYYSRVLLKTVKEAAVAPVTATAINVSRNGQPLPEVDQEPVVIYEGADDAGEEVRVIVAGVATPYTVRPSLRDSLPGYDFGFTPDAKQTKQGILDDLAASLRGYDRPGDVVVVLSHLGYAGPEGNKDGRITGPDLGNVANVDFVADGHTHTAIKPFAADHAVYGNGGRYLEHFLEITIPRAGTRTMELKSYGDVADIPPDAAIDAWLAAAEQRQGLTHIAFELPATDRFGDSDVRTDNTPLGRLVCRAMLQAAEADMAFHNVGGIRAGLSGGPVSIRALYDVLLFGDDLVVVSMDGKEIAALFNRGSGPGGRGFPQFYGIMAYAWRTEDGNLQSAGFIDANGAPLRDDKLYRVAMNSIMAKVQSLSGSNEGELIKIMIRELSGAAELRLEDLVEASPLLIFADRQAAEAAFQAALAGK